jgi:hypothetical protein
MIVKVAGGRRDGRTSFKDLGAYLTEGILQSGENPLKTSWDALTQYITKESVLNALGDDVEKTIAVEIDNLLSLKTAPIEMEAVASQNARVKDPVYHYILSWPETERPAPEAIFQAARHTLSALGLSRHQYIIAIHANTDNIHAHVEVNRVHPRTYKAALLTFAHATLHQAAREVEIEFGWSHDNGIFEVVTVNGQQHIVKVGARRKKERTAGGAGAKRFEIWNGEESLLTWCKGDPATALKRVIADPKTSTWQDIHVALARFGLALRDSDGAGMKIFDVSDGTPEKQGKPLAVAASSAFRVMKRAELERRFGPFMAAMADTMPLAPERTYKRDPVKRQERQLERRAVRDALHARFRKEVDAVKEQQALARQVIAEVFNDDKQPFAELDQRYRQKRVAVTQAKDLEPSQKKMLHIVNRVNMQQERQALKELLAQSRADRRALIPKKPVWREWVEQQAQLGDEAAISALRGMIYQDGRVAKKAGNALEGAEQAADVENTIRPAMNVDTDPYVRTVPNLVWKVAKNGRVNYTFTSGEAAFSDEGDRLAFHRKEVSDEALIASLRYAAEKWGGTLHLAGGDAVFKERALRVAAAHGIRIANPELQRLQSQLQAPQSRPPATGSDSDYEALQNLIVNRNKTANIIRPGANGKSYADPIVGENDRYVVQHTGGNDYVIHDKAAIGSLLGGSGKAISIQYQDGHGVVQKRRDRTRGR